MSNTSAWCAGSTKVISYYASTIPLNSDFAIIISDSEGQFSSSPDTISKHKVTQLFSYTNINVSMPSNLTASSNYKMKAVWQGGSSNPYTFIINASSLVTASISGNYSRAACSYNNATLIPVIFTGQGPFKITFNDSLRNRIYESEINSTLLTHNLYVYDNYPNTITLLSVSNACGVGIAGGKANIRIVYPTITIGTPSDTVICAGEKIRIPYTNSNSFCPVSFQLSDSDGKNFKTVYPYTYIPPNNYDFTIPENTPPSDNYKIRIVNYAKDTWPIPSDSVVGNFTLSIKARPKLSISNSNVSSIMHPYGTIIPLNFIMEGTPPFNFYFNGQRYTSNFPSLEVKHELLNSH